MKYLSTPLLVPAYLKDGKIVPAKIIQAKIVDALPQERKDAMKRDVVQDHAQRQMMMRENYQNEVKQEQKWYYMRLLEIQAQDE